MGTHLKVLSESFPMNTNMTGFRWFSKIFEFLCLGQNYSLSIGRVNPFNATATFVQRTRTQIFLKTI